ncbi:MAG TPA: hypothetical protein DGZ24_07545, partial [Rhodospirillaceae bacterium]|nr:hypothetical protein [Rhodospirillaceae bacterium]
MSVNKLERQTSEISENESKTATPLLDSVDSVQTLRQLPVSQLRQLSDELRTETINAASVTGGHFGAGLGVVEL